MKLHRTMTCFPAAAPRLSGMLLLALMLPGLLVFPACSEKKPPEIRLADLTEAEHLYVSRIVILERAKAVALVDRPAGDALLDSLAAAWGDSARSDTAAGVPDDPRRAQQVGRLLNRILEAELDSLIRAPRPDRLALPLPDPDPKAAPKDGASQ